MASVPRVVWDNHVCLPLDPGKSGSFGDLARHRASGFTTVGVNIGFADAPWSELEDFAARFSEWARENSDWCRLVRSTKDIKECADKGILGAFLDVEGASFVAGDLSRVRRLYALGVRWMCLAYNTSNDLVGGCHPNAVDGGLTKAGREAILEMNRCGMIVCCTHTGRRSALDIIDFNEKPSIFSHSNCNEVYAHWRNIDDDLVINCAAKGGVICVNGVGPFLGRGAACEETLIRHLDHVVDLVGIDHVGIGLDYVYDQSELTDVLQSNPSLFGDDLLADGAFSFLPPERLENIGALLRARGYAEEDMSKVLGENLFRVADANWK